MTWTVRVLGLAEEEAIWRVDDLPDDAGAQDASVRERFPDHVLHRGHASGRSLVYVARPTVAVPLRDLAGPELSLLTEDGPDAGRLAPVPGRGLSVGRGGGAMLLDDPTAPSQALHLALGPAALVVRRPGCGRPEAWDVRSALAWGTTTLTTVRGGQPPLEAPRPPAPAVVELGSPPAEQSMVLPVLTAAGPLVIGVVLAVTSGSMLFLLFGVMSILVAATMLSLQRRARRTHARTLRGRAEQTAALRARSAPGPGQVSRAARAHCPDRFAVATGRAEGHGALRWGQGSGALPLSRPEAAARWQEATDVPQAALTSLAPGCVVQVDGAPRTAAASARWTLFQLLRDAVASGRTLTVCTPSGATCWWSGTPSAAEARVHLPSSPWLETAHGVWRAALAGTTLTAAARPDDAPVTQVRFTPGADGATTDHVDLTGGTVHSPGDGTTVRDLVPTGISSAVLEWWLRELADDVLGLDLLPGGAAPTPLRVPAAVGTSSTLERVRAPLTSTLPPHGRGAVSSEEGLWLDLAADGPHVLVAGTTGSGKSDLLLSVLVGLTVAHPPAELALILLDFKGGASFGPLAALPHTMSLETNHVGSASLRALSAISAELRRREGLFAAAGASDYPAFRRRRPDEVLPRLVVAVDELRVLMDDHPQAGAVLQRLAATGRSLGFHLLLATQRATGAVSGDIRSNLGTTIALRTATEQESWDLVGTAEAFRLDAALPGSAVLARAGRPPKTFRAAQWSTGAAIPVWRPARSTDPTPTATGSWEEVVACVARRYAQRPWPMPDPVVSPALPALWIPERTSRRGAEALALLDDAAHARHTPWRWPRGAEGGTAWIVEPAGGRARVLAAVLEVASRSPGGVLVLDGSGEAGTSARAGGLPVLTPHGSDAAGDAVMKALTSLARGSGTAVFTGWAAWSGLRVGESYRSLEEELHRWLGTEDGRRLRVAALGGRDLAVSRLLLHLPHRFYVPAGTSAEHRLVWPRLTEVEAVPGRAVHLGPDIPEPGRAAQLAFPAGPERSPAAAGGPSGPDTRRIPRRPAWL